MKVVLWIIGIPVGLFILLMIFAKPGDPAAEKAECVQAMMSDMGTRPKSYLDKQAYDAHVADKCRNFEINGRPIGR